MDNLTDIILTLKGLNPKQKFNKDMRKITASYGFKSAKNAQKAVLEYLSSSETKITKKTEKACLRIISEVYEKDVSEIKNKLAKKRERLYKHYKRRLPIEKSNWVKESRKKAGISNMSTKGMTAKLYEYIHKAKTTTLTYDLNRIDKRAIKWLTEADAFFIKDHAPNSAIARKIVKTLTEAQKEGKFTNQIASELKTEFAEYTPEKYAKIFGETSYWTGVVNVWDTTTKTATTINDFRSAGVETYRWYARDDERTCETCLELHNKVMSVKVAGENLDNYLKAAEDGEYEKLKEINPWIGQKEAEQMTEADGYTAPAHLHCRCYERLDLGYDYD